MWFGWGFMMWVPIALVIIGAAIYYAVTSTSRREGSSTYSNNQQTRYQSGRAIEILRERYAKGEITKEQFLEMKEELR